LAQSGTSAARIFRGTPWSFLGAVSAAVPPMSRLVTGLVLLCFAVACGGPSTDLVSCDPALDYLRCNGNKVSHCTCTKNGPRLGTDFAGRPLYSCEAYSWVDDTACSVACDAAINPTSGCIASEQAVPECAQDGFTCWNGNLTGCLNGYPLPTTPCREGTLCTLVAGCQALCLSSPATVDPRCPALPGHNDFCADNTAYYCACGYLVGSTACGAPPSNCVTVSSYDTFDKVSGQAALCGLPP